MQRMVGYSSLLAAAILVATACAEDPGRDASTGAVKGVVLFSGGAAPKDAIVGDAVLSLIGAALRPHAGDGGGAKPAPAAAVLNQKNLTFVPHVLAVMAPATVEFKNGDAVMHNVHAECLANRPFNLAQLAGKRSKVTFTEPEIIQTQCEVHSQMRAWIVVLDNPYFTQPEKDGHFEIRGVPPGHYTLHAWHETYQDVKVEVDVKAGGTTEISPDFAQRRKA